MPESRIRAWRAHKGLFMASLVVFVATNVIFPNYLPDTPVLGYTHLAIIALSGGVALWLLLARTRS